MEDKGPTATPAEPPLDKNEDEEVSPTSPQVVEKDLLEPESEETAEDEKSKEDIVEVADQTLRMDDDTPQPMITADTPVNAPAELPIDPEDEASRSSQAATPFEEAEPDQMEVVDEEGVASGDEPLQRARQASKS